MKSFVTKTLLSILILLSTALLADKGTPSPQALNWADNKNTSDARYFWINIGPNQELDATITNDDTVYVVTLPFTFNFYSVNFTQVYVSSNGLLSFHPITDSFKNSDNFTVNQNPDSIIAAYWDNVTYTATNARIDTLTTGEAPYRKFIIQYTNINSTTFPAPANPMTMQVILHETTNLIKKQYLTAGALNGNDAAVGVRFPAGGATDEVQRYAYNATPRQITDQLAILYYPSDSLSGQSALDVTEVVPNTSNQNFTLNISNLDLTGSTFLDNMGKADIVRINKPAVLEGSPDGMTVSAVTVDGNPFFILNSTTPPTEAQISAISNIATWYYDDVNNNLYVQFPPLGIRGQVSIEFQTDIPDGLPLNLDMEILTEVSARLEPGKSVTLRDTVTATTYTLTAETIADTGFVDSTLATKFNVRVTDGSGAGVSNVPISFAIVSKPSGAANEFVSPATNETSSSGLVQTNVHLGTRSGQYVVRAFAPNTTPQTVDFTGTAIPREPDSILIVSGNNQSGDLGQPLPQAVRFRVVDRFENGIPDTVINFNPVDGSVNPTSQSADAQGEAATTWTLSNLGTTQRLVASAPTVGGGTVFSDTAMATASPGPAAQLELVQLRKVAQDSAAAVPGESVTFIVRALDVNGNPVPNATINFEALPGYNVTFETTSDVTDANGRVTNVASTDVNQNETFFRAILPGQDSLDLHVFHLTYVNNSLSPSVTSPGQTVSFSLDINNSSPRAVGLATDSTFFRFTDGTRTFSATLSGATTLTANGNTTLQFQATQIDPNFLTTSFTPTLILKGTGQNSRLSGTLLLPANSLALFDVQIAVVDVAPDTVTMGRQFTFSAQLTNTGSGNVTLDPANSFLGFGSDMIPLKQSYALPGNGTVTVEFAPTAITTPANTSPYVADIILSGTRNGFPFRDTLLVAASIRVQRRPRVVVSSITLPGGTNVSQDQDSVQVDLVLRNSGSNRATAEIDLSSGLTLATGQLSNIRPTTSGTLSLAANQSSTTLSFFFNVGGSYPTGADEAVASYRFVDANSGDAVDTTATDDPASFTVLSRSRLALIDTSLAPLSVQPNGVTTFSFTVENTGEADAVIDNAGDIAITFNNNHAISLQSGQSFPLTIDANGGLEVFTYQVTINATPTIGPDPLDLSVTHRDAISNKSYTDVQEDNLFTLQIFDGISTDDLQIQLVTAPQSVVQGQSGLSATARLKNFSNANITIDSLVLFSSNPGISANPLLNQSINAGETKTFAFSFSVSGAATPGTDTIDVRYRATNPIDGSKFTGLGAVSPAVVNVFRPPALTFSNLSLNPSMVSSGQSNIDYFATVTNGDSTNSPVRITSLSVLAPTAGGLITAVQITPQILPQTLSGGQSLQVQYRLSVDVALAEGTYPVSLRAVGQDVNVSGGAGAVDDTSGVLNLQVQSGANLQITAVEVREDSALVGQDTVAITVSVQNQGGASAQLNNVTLILRDQSGLDPGFTPTLVTLDLPKTLSSGQTATVQFALDVPENLVIAPTQNMPIFFGARLSGVDVNSAAVQADTVLNADVLRIFSAPQLSFNQLLSPSAYNLGDVVALQVQVSNSGGAVYRFGAGSVLRLVKDNDSDVQDTVLIDLSPSDDQVNGNSTATMIFQSTQLARLGRFRLFLDIRGSSFGQTVNFLNINTGQNITVGGSLDIQQLAVTPAVVNPGADGMVANLRLANLGGVPLSIDGGDTTRLEFRYTDNNELLPITATRIDNRTELPGGGQVDSLRWQFNIPAGARAGILRVVAFLSFDGGNFSDSTSTTFTIQSDVSITHAIGSLSPAQVVPGQSVQFRARFVNNSTSSLLINAAASFVEFTDGIHTYTANVGGSFSIVGSSAGPDTSELIFATTALNAAFQPGIYNVRFFITGSLPNGDIVTAVNSTFANQVQVLQKADVEIVEIVFDPDTLLAGQQTDVRYVLRNNGASDARITFAESKFADANEVNISNLWSLVSETPVDTVFAGQTDTLVRRFTVSANIGAGTVKARLAVKFTDVRTPNTLVTVDNLTPVGTAEVLLRPTVAFDVQIASPPGAIDGLVSTFQRFEWQISVTHVFNSGPLDSASPTAVRLNFANKGFFFDSALTQTEKIVNIFPDVNPVQNVSIWAGANPRFAVLRASIIDTSDSPAGEPALLTGPNFIDVEMEIQRRADLKVNLTGPGVVGIDNAFTLNGIVQNLGSAGTVPATARLMVDYDHNNFTLVGEPDDILDVTINQGFLLTFQPDPGVTGPFDFTLTLDNSFPIQDVNSDSAVFVSQGTDGHNVNLTASAIAANIVDITPAGAQDGVVSSGQVFTITVGYQYQTVLLDTGRSARIILPPGYSTAPLTIGLSSDSTGTVSWNVVAPDSAVSLSTIIIELEGYQDVGGGNVQRISVQQSLPIQTVTRAALSVDASIVNPPGATDGTFSTGQFFDLKIKVNNAGTAATQGTNQVTVTLPAVYTPATFIRQIASGDSATVRIQAPATPTQQSGNISARLTQAAVDTNTNAPATILQPVDNITGVRTVQRADVRLLVSSLNQFSTNREGLPVSISISNSGTADLVQNDTAVTAIPVNVQIDTDSLSFPGEPGIASKVFNVPFSNTTNSGNLSITLNTLGNQGAAAIRAGLQLAGIQDENIDTTGAQVFSSQSSNVATVNILEAGMVGLQPLQIVSPAGAADNTLSSGQVFTLQAVVNFAGNLVPANNTVSLTLPAGFLSNSPLQITGLPPGNSTVTWNLVAASGSIGSPPGGKSGDAAPVRVAGAARQNPAMGENTGRGTALLADDFTLRVSVSGVDTSGVGSQPSTSDSLTVTVVERAKVAVRSQLVAPAGALDGTLSTHQRFDVRLWVDLSGEAGVQGNNILTIGVPAGFRISGMDPGQSLTLAVATRPENADTISIFAPDTVPAGAPQISVTLDSAALDENRNRQADIVQQSASFNVGVVRRAALRIDSLRTTLPIVAPNQNFDVTARITNLGDAAVLPGDSVYARLNIDGAAFEFRQGGELRGVRLSNKQAVVTWPLRATATPPTGKYEFTATIDPTGLQDANHNYPDTLVFVETPQAVTADSLEVVNIEAAGIQSAYINAPGTDSLQVSSRQQVTVFLSPNITFDFSEATATLQLPGIFSHEILTRTITAGNPVQWALVMPDTSSNGLWEPLSLSIRAVSKVNGAEFTADTTLYLQLQRRANLVAEGAVEGLFNNVVRQGAPFAYRVVINNIGEAGVRAAPPGELTLTLGDKISLAEGDTSVKAFAIGDTVRWNLLAAPNAAIAGLLQQIRSADQQRSELMRRLTGATAVAEGSNAGAAAEMEALHLRLKGLQQQLRSLVETTFLSARITRRPLDANAGTRADTSVGTVRHTVQIAEPAGIGETSITAPDFASTEQIIELSVQAEFVGEVIERRARIIDVGGFSIVDGDSVRAFTEAGVARWALRAPASPGGPSEVVPLRVRIEGRDPNSDPANPVIVTKDAITSTTVEQKAFLNISSQQMVLNLSRGDTVTVSVTVQNTGTAGLTGEGRLDINIGTPGFEIDGTSRTFIVDNQSGLATVSWQIITPNATVNTIATVTLSQIPLDENTGAPAAVNTTALTLDINMTPSRLQISRVGNIQAANSYVQGQSNLAVMGLALFNPSTGETLEIDNFQLQINDGATGGPVTDLGSLLTRVEVITLAEFLSLSDPTAPASDKLTEINIDAGTTNPFLLEFDPLRELLPEQTDSLVIRIDLASGNVNRKFNVRLNNIRAMGASSRIAEVFDALGVPLGESFDFQSASITVLSDDPEQIFRNYPNPFGMDTQIPGEAPGTTRFMVWMNGPGEATLSIYTLTGRLVWRESRQLGTGLNPRAFIWDGVNGRGFRVVNGVYVAILEANGQKLQTRVVYLK